MNDAKESAKDIIASCFGSAASALTGQPFDTIKVRLQVGSSEFPNSWKCIKNTVTQEGFGALWKGLSPAFFGAVSENATAFALNGQLNRLLGPEEKDSKSLIRPFLLGAISGFVTAFVLCPSDIIKCRQQVLRTQGREITSPRLISDLYRSNGLRGFYIGIGAQIMRDIPFFAFFFGTYEALCPILVQYTSFGEAASCFIAGGVAGQLAWVSSLPFDTVKSIVQTSAVTTSDTLLQTPENSIQVARRLYTTQGLPVFFRGLGITILRAFPSNAALFLGYEWTRKTCDSVW